MSSDMSAFLITAFLSDMVLLYAETIATRPTSLCQGAKSPLAFQLSVRNYMHYFWAKYNNFAFTASTSAACFSSAFADCDFFRAASKLLCTLPPAVSYRQFSLLALLPVLLTPAPKRCAAPELQIR